LSLDEIDLNNSNSIYYTYKYCDFYYKKIDTTDKLVISFHGNIDKWVPVPVFRGYDYKFNILCFFDMMCKANRENNISCCSWFLSTEKICYKNVYIEIIQYFIKPALYTNVIFVASSAGCHIAFLYAIYFKKKAILMNAQFYIEKHYLFPHLLNETGLKKEEFIDFEIEEFIKKYGMPEKTLIFINRYDVHHYNEQFRPFKQFLTEMGLLNKVVFNEFNGRGPNFNAHWDNLPLKVKLEQVVKTLFNKANKKPVPVLSNFKIIKT
jgi:hypothetical protein